MYKQCVEFSLFCFKTHDVIFKLPEWRIRYGPGCSHKFWLCNAEVGSQLLKAPRATDSTAW